MAYYPENRIITDQFTNGGEFVIKSTKEPYLGSYYILYNGTFFTGKNQNDGVSRELIPLELPPANVNNDSLLVYVTPENDLKANDYLRIIGGLPPIKRLPIPFYPNPTLKDYELGEFQRYFAKKINEYIFTEIDQQTYTKLSQNNDEYYWRLYYSFSLPWELRGDKTKVEQINRSVTAQTEINFQVYGFSKFIEQTGGYLQFYQFPNISNLYTSGSEFKTADGRNYVGFYHIHDKTGPMVGATHTKEPHGLLFPINETIVSKAINQQTPQVITQTTSSYTPPSSPMSTGGGFSGGGGYSGGGGGGGY